jgi:serine/threonine protein phosphatase PrpC
VLGRGAGAERTCRDLVEAANTRGGPDNVTVVVAQFRDERQPATAGQHQAAMAAESGEGALAGVQGSASPRPQVPA